MAHPSRVMVGRQAIVDRGGEIFGYELLFRSSAQSLTSDDVLVSGEQMTADVIFGALTIGLEQVVAGKKIFFNADRSLLVGDLPVGLPPGQLVIEVLETVAVDDAVISGCRKLVEQGCQLALDDFVWFDGAEELAALASYIKIDVQAVRGAELTRLVEQCRPFGLLLAEKVETQDELDRYRDMGFDLFQGYHLERPVVVSGWPAYRWVPVPTGTN